MLADIASGNVDAADIFFLIAVILAVIAGILAITKNAAGHLVQGLGWFAVACAAFGLLML